MRKEDREKLFSLLEKTNPHPTTELNYTSTFELLIAVLLSAHTTDVSVNKATKTLFRMAPSAEKMLRLGEERLKQQIKTIGLYNSKAAHIIKTCHILVTKHKGQVPQTREELECLPGVGRKTANVVLNTAFGHGTIAVDTHIFRVSNRTGLAPGKNVQQVEELLMQRVPPQYIKNAHHWLILHGRYTCKARRPRCGQCSLINLCAYKDKSLPAPKASSKEPP